MDNLHKIQTIIDKWTGIANESDTRVIIDEMKTLLEELKEAGVSMRDILKFKDRILKVWIQLSWSEAKEKHPDWQTKEWWKKRRDRVIRAFGDCVKDMSSDTKPKNEAKSEEDYFKHIPNFDNVEDLLKWKARRSANS